MLMMRHSMGGITIPLVRGAALDNARYNKGEGEDMREGVNGNSASGVLDCCFTRLSLKRA